jgi:cytolysin-activating lysine-acyltransferase
MVSGNGVAAEEVGRPVSPPAAPQAGIAASPGITEKVRRQAAAMQHSFAFTQVVGVLMRSERYKNYTLADLEWLIIPALLAGQFRIGEVKAEKGDTTLPAAVILWASVSPEVDQRLMQADTAAVRLQPDEWKSGDILWVLHSVGDTRFLRELFKKLAETTFKGREVKVRGRAQDGKPAVHVLPAA